MPNLPRFILMPPLGMYGDIVPADRMTAILADNGMLEGNSPAQPIVRLLHETCPNGPKLIEATPSGAQRLRSLFPGLRVLPEMSYATPGGGSGMGNQTAPAPAWGMSFRVQDAEVPARGLKNAVVQAFFKLDPTNLFNGSLYVSGISDDDGFVTLNFDPVLQKLGLAAPPSELPAILVRPPYGYWGYFHRNVPVGNYAIDLAPIDAFKAPDVLRACFGVAPDGAGKSVRVGVIDFGIDRDHPDLAGAVAGGYNCVVAYDGPYETNDPKDWGPSSDHGTHVAGIIGAHGSWPTHARGVAPGSELMSYRIFPKTTSDPTDPSAENASCTAYSVVLAIHRAIEDRCHLINMSIGAPFGSVTLGTSEAENDALAEAYRQGIVAFVAAGNVYRDPVCFPASSPYSVAVSMMGHVGTFPANAWDAPQIVPPFATSNPLRFIASMSGCGVEVSLTGPGAGVVSTVPGGGRAVMSGTSMACPAVTGVAAALLAKRPDILAGNPGPERANAILTMVYQSAKLQGFGPVFEGFGLPMPPYPNAVS